MGRSPRARMDTVIAGGLVLTPDGLVDTDVGIRAGRVVAFGAQRTERERIDARGLWILPGVIDGHTHLDAPAFGITTRDTFESGTQSAAAGGVSTVIDFTLGGDTATLAGQVRARAEAARQTLVDVGLHAEIVGWRPDRSPEIADAIGAGATSFKFYTVYAERSSPEQLADAFRAIAAAGGVAMVHAEDLDAIRTSSAAISTSERAEMSSFPRSRPRESEVAAVEQVCAIAHAAGVRLHFAHISTAAAASAIARAKARGVDVTAETCPHYLLLDERAYEQQDGKLYSVVPPLRTPEDRGALWSALADGTLDTVATDHCPFLGSDKLAADDVLHMPCGLPGVETLLPLLFSEGVAMRSFTPQWLARVLSANPSRIFGLARRKGTLAIGGDADLVFFDPKREWIISSARLHTRADFTPFEGRRVRGAVVRTCVRGRTVYADGEFTASPGWGRFISAVAAP